MPVVNPALMNSGNINTTQKVRDVSPTLAFLAPRYAQLLLLSTRIAPAPYNQAFGIPEAGAKTLSLGIRTVTNFKFEWYEDQMKSTTTKVNNGGGYNNAAVSIVVDDASIFAKNDLVDVVSTGEILEVTAVDVGTNTLTVVRSWGATAAANIADDATLLIIGNAFSETIAMNLQPFRITDSKYNYIQDTRHAFAGSYVLDKHELYAAQGGQRNAMRSKFICDHQRYMEASLLFGEAADGVGTDGSPKKTTGGFIESIASSSAVTNVGGAITKSVWNSWLSDLFQYGSNEKIVMASPLVCSAISNFAADNSSTPASQVYVLNNANEFGLNIMTYRTKFGVIHLLMHGMLTGDVYGGYALGIDPMKLRLARVRGGFFMNLREDIVQDGAHRWVDEYASYFGLEVSNAPAHGMLTGITG